MYRRLLIDNNFNIDLNLFGHVQKKNFTLRDIAKTGKHKFLFYLKVKPLMKILFAHKCFKSCYRYFVQRYHLRNINMCL